MAYRLENPEALWGLVPLGILLVWMLLRRPQRAPLRRWFLVALGLFCAVMGLARIQGGFYSTNQTGLKGDLYLALDISASMNAQDMTPSRLQYAAHYARQLLEQLPGIRVALFVFAADGYLQMPLSKDPLAATDLLTALHPSMTTQQGTQFDSSLSTLYTAIAKGIGAHATEPAPTRVLLFSDGETHEPLRATTLRKFRALAVPIDTVGVGTPAGAPIPEGPQSFARGQLRDSSGQVVISRLTPAPLQQIAKETGGTYYGPEFEQVALVAARITQGMSLGKLTTTFALEQETYPYFFLAALTLLSIEVLFGPWPVFLRAAWLATLWFSAAPLPPANALDDDTMERLEADPKRAPYHAYNEGLRQVEQGQLGEAAQLFGHSADTAQDPILRKKALYNLGNTLLQMQDPKQALSVYQRARDTQTRKDAEINSLISKNMALAAQLQQQQQQQRSQEQSDESQGDGEGQDPGRPRDYQDQNFTEEQKRRLYDLVSSEEQQVMQRLGQSKKKGAATDPKGKPW